jgi:hypothetical protein
MPTRDRLARKTKQGATAIVHFSCQISIIKQMFTNNAASYVQKIKLNLEAIETS